MAAISQEENIPVLVLKEGTGIKKGKSTQKNVKPEEAFHFKTDEDGYTGIVAVSLCDLANKLEAVPLDSVLFHYYRGDFQRWIRDVFGDNQLANQMNLIAANRWMQELANRIDLLAPSLSGEKLRERLVELIRKRLAASTEGNNNDLSSAKIRSHTYTNT